MFCPNCGKDCADANFCSGCGQALRSTENEVKSPVNYPPLNEPYIVTISGQMVDLNKIVRMYGTGWRKSGAYGYLISNFGVSAAQARKILDPIYAAHEGEEISFLNSLSANASLKKETAAQNKDPSEVRRQQLEESGQAYCPKCLSTSVTAKKKGYSVGWGLLAGPLAGAIGANKIRCVCLKCGHEWIP